MKKLKPILALTSLLAVALLALPVMAQVKDFKEIKYPQVPEFNFDKPEIFKLDNGMTVFMIEDRELPLIEVSARIRTGSNYIPADKTGLGAIFGQVQREGGTAKMSGDEIDDFLEARAASIETGVGGDSASASMDCLKDDFDEVFDLFVDILRNPAFSEDKIDLAKVQNKTAIARRNDNVGGIIGREFTRLVYGKDSPLSRIPEYATIANIDRADLVAWHEKYYHPNNIYLGIVGDFDSKAMKGMLSSKLKGWPKGPAFNEPEPAYDKQPKKGVYFVEKSDVTQANIRMGHLGISMKNPDYFAVQVMNEVLGGGFAGRLFSNVRSKKGLAYSVFGGVGASPIRDGICQVGMSTKSETMAESVGALREELKGIINNPPSEEEMKRAKDSILNSFVFNYDSKAEILNQQMVYAYYGLPADFLEKYRSNIEKVSREQAAAAAKKYIHPDNSVLLVVGKASDFDKPMSIFGEVSEIDITIPAPADTSPAIPKNAASLADGSMLFSKVAKAFAGTDPAINSVAMKFTTTISMGGQKMAMGQAISVALPDKFVQVNNTPMGEQSVVINGDRGFASFGGQTQVLSSEQVQDGHKNLGRELFFMATQHDRPDFEAVAAGKDSFDGRQYDVVSVTLAGTESRLWVDDAGRVARQVYQGTHPMQGTPGEIEVVFSDYRDLGGHSIPHKRVMMMDGEEILSMSVDSMEFNVELDDSLFEIPENI